MINSLLLDSSLVLIIGLMKPASYRWQVRRFSPSEGGRHCKSTLRGGEDGESMLPLGYSQNAGGISHVLLSACQVSAYH